MTEVHDLQLRADLFTGANVTHRLDSHPENDPDGSPVPILLLGWVVNNGGVEVIRAVRPELSATLAPHMSNAFLDGVSFFTMSESGDLFAPMDGNGITHIEGFQVTRTGRVESGFQFAGAKFESRTTQAIETYAFEGIHYSFPPSAINIPDADKWRGKRVKLNP